MSKGRYYFPEIEGNGALSRVAQISKNILTEWEEVLEIYKNNPDLCQQSPGKFSYLMELNTRSIFDLDSNISLSNRRQQKESNFPTRKPSEYPSTPVKRNTLPRKYLLNIDKMKADSETETMSIRERITSSSKNNDSSLIVKPNIDFTDMIDDVFISPTNSDSPKRIGNSDAIGKESLGVDSNANATSTDDGQSFSPVVYKMAGKPDAAKKESIHSAPTTKMLTRTILNDHKTETPQKVNKIDAIFPDNAQKSDNSGQIVENAETNYSAKKDSSDLVQENTKMPNLKTEEKHTPSPVKRARIFCDEAVQSKIQVLISPVEKAGIAVDPAQDTKVYDVPLKDNKMNISPIERTKKIAISDERKSSPRRNTFSFRSIPRIIRSEGAQVMVIELPWELDENPISTTSRFLTRDLRVGETSANESPGNSSAKESIGSDILDETKIEISPVNLQRKLRSSGNKSLTEMGSPTKDLGFISRKTISPSARPSKAIMPPPTLEHRISPIEKNTFKSSLKNLPNANTPERDIEHIPRNRISPSTRLAQKRISPKGPESNFNSSSEKNYINTPKKDSEVERPHTIKGYSPRQISPSACSMKTETQVESLSDCDAVLHPNALKWNKNKLDTLFSNGDDCTTETFESFSEFQEGLKFLFLNVTKISNVVKKILIPEQKYITEDFKQEFSDLSANTDELIRKLNLWKTTGNSEVLAWIKCSEEIINIQSRNEKRINTDASPVEGMRFLREYENDLKSEWKKMYDMKILQDARRSLFYNTAQDFEKVIKLFVKCLINIGVLKVCSKTS